MTLEQLHKKLGALLTAGVPPKTTVLLARDPEGNGFSPANDIEQGNWSPRRDEYTGHPDDLRDQKLKKNAICIWPR
jgi:hypothetical protein